jgi:hypothetical protein
MQTIFDDEYLVIYPHWYSLFRYTIHHVTSFCKFRRRGVESKEMAPFNTHFLVAEKIWPEITARLSWPVTANSNHYGQFCFGCVASDVDKTSLTLTQKDTHFFDRTTDYELMASHRSAAFLQDQADFLCGPFASLSAEAQAFALGYLCHLCVDEVSKHMWRRPVWVKLKPLHPGASFAALDEAAWQRIQNYSAITEAVCSIKVLDVIPRIPLTDLERMHQGVCNFVQAKSVEGEFLALVDLFDRPTPAQRRKRLQRFRAEINTARRQVHFFELEQLVRSGLAHSRQRLTDLIEGRVPEPSYPVFKS